MTFDLPTIIAIRRRMEHLRAHPLLFHDVRTPARQRARIERLGRWLGFHGLVVTDCIMRRGWVADSGTRYSRHFTPHPINQEN